MSYLCRDNDYFLHSFVNWVLLGLFGGKQVKDFVASDTVVLRLHEHTALISLENSATQAGHTDAHPDVVGDVPTVVNLSPRPRELLLWKVTHNGRFVPYYAALDEKGVVPTSEVQVGPYPRLDLPTQFQTAKGWEVGPERLHLQFGEVVLWDGHLWHAGGSLVASDTFNTAWWARLLPGKEEEGEEGPHVYAVDCIPQPGNSSTRSK